MVRIDEAGVRAAAHATWQRDPATRVEFGGDEQAFVAYEVASAKGQASIYSGAAAKLYRSPAAGPAVAPSSGGGAAPAAGVAAARSDRDLDLLRKQVEAARQAESSKRLAAKRALERAEYEAGLEAQLREFQSAAAGGAR